MQTDLASAIDELGRYFEKTQLKSDGEAFCLERRTPAHYFRTILAPLEANSIFVAIRARDLVDDRLAFTLLEFVKKNRAHLDESKPAVVLEGFHVQGYAFDSVLVLRPAGHEIFRVENPVLHARTLEVSPIYRCEFSGQEDAELVMLVRNKFVSTIDWKRSPSPRIWIKFNNVRTQARSRGKKPVLATLRYLLHELKELPGSPGSFIEVQNFRGEQCRLTCEEDAVLIESPLLLQAARLREPRSLGPLMEAFVSSGGSRRLREFLSQ